MDRVKTCILRGRMLVLVGCGIGFFSGDAGSLAAEKSAKVDLAGEYTAQIRPLLSQYCLKCHSTKKMKGDLDLERFISLGQVRQGVRVWQSVLEMLESEAMPPKEGTPLPSEGRRRLTAWVRNLLDVEAHAHAGDPGRVVVRRLSNAEFNNTIRDLTGVDLQPARDFPVDGAAGEGFTNAGDALVTSPTLVNKYFNAAKDIAAHAVLLPDGMRFSPSKTRRDWTNEILVALRGSYTQYSSEGKLPLRPYITAAVRYRAELVGGKVTAEEVAAREKLNRKYFRILWHTLNDSEPSYPLDTIRAHWRRARMQDVDSLLAEITSWQERLWRFVPIGSYRYGNTIRQLPNDPATVETQALKVSMQPVPGQTDVVLYLSAKELAPGAKDGFVLWRLPRFENGKESLLLRDYAEFGGKFEFDYHSLFANTARYLAATAAAAKDRRLNAETLARKHGLDSSLLKRWIDLMALAPADQEIASNEENLRWTPVPSLELLDQRLPKNDKDPVQGWSARTADMLPSLISNASDRVEHVPGTIPPHRVAVHPTPSQFAAAVWRSPLEGRVRVKAKITHAHPACGNGIAWWLEQRRGDRAALLAEGALDLGKGADVPERELKVKKGDLVELAIDPRDGNHACDLTEITLTVIEVGKGRTWDLARDVADSVHAGNPHADSYANPDVWRFVRGPARKSGDRGQTIPPDSVLARWRNAASNPKVQQELGTLADRVQALLAGERPHSEKHPDRLLYDRLVSLESPLLQGIDLPRLGKGGASKTSQRYGLDRARFGRHPQGQPADPDAVVVPATSVLEIRLPASLFRNREFVVEGKLDSDGADRAVQLKVLTAPPGPDAPVEGSTPCVVTPGGKAARRLIAGLDQFRACFPQFISYAKVIPDDEGVCLKLFHREDEPLIRLFLDDVATKRLDRLWSELRFISQYPVVEHKQLPLFIGFVTQDQPKELLAYFESQRPAFRERAEKFEHELEQAITGQMEALLKFASLAYRRPLRTEKKNEIERFYAFLRKKPLSHEQAFRVVLARVLVSPSFLFRIEGAPPGKEARPVSDWELATRLSYFLWATMPDAELLQAAASGRLRDPKVLAAQAERMLHDPRVRGLAEEFGTQWLHVRDIEKNREKNEKLFPTFNDELRRALFEETVLFLQDLFQRDRPVRDILDADYTFLNEVLAAHYGIPGVAGPEWRRVDGVKQYGRGGVLALGSVLTKQSGASRTSPVLRGNWLIEAMLGEKLPKPPANVPQLPEEEATSAQTVRQLVERHVRAAQCSVCHQRIDPYGFALEHYDPLGRFRDKDLGGRPIDARAVLKDGTHFEGVEGLRTFLLRQRGKDFERHFCQKLLGYALGRTVTLSDEPLLDEMRHRLKQDGNRLSAVVFSIIQSKQFRFHGGADVAHDE